MPTPARPFLILSGSARTDGNTQAVAERLRASLPRDASTLIALAPLHLRPFRYEAAASNDDGFQPLVDRLLQHAHIVFVTPVYWYAMSGTMKTFFDRLTDLLLSPELRPKGRALAGRKASLLATGTDPKLPPSFVEPFRLTASYFAMGWGEVGYIRSLQGAPLAAAELAKVDRFAETLST